MGAVLDRSAFELVNSNFRALPVPPWDTSAAAPNYLPGEGSPEPARRLRVLAHLTPASVLPKVLPALEGGWQSRRGDTLEVSPTSGTDSAPERGVIADPLLGADDPGLARAAALAAGRESQPARVAQALNDWVRRTIRVREGAGTWSAARAFRNRSGTAIERVRVLVALARSAGMEARQVSGLVRVNGRWQLREWAEIWTGTWTPADPGLASTSPLANRIRLITGGDARQLDLALRAGRLRLDVLEETQ
jgi:transglutaminase-like putative cysteine protease